MGRSAFSTEITFSFFIAFFTESEYPNSVTLTT
jgi:hypothetical protein